MNDKGGKKKVRLSFISDNLDKENKIVTRSLKVMAHKNFE